MKNFRRNIFSIFLGVGFFVSQNILASERCEISHYSLKVQFNEKRGKFQAEAKVWITALEENLTNVVFTFPPNIEFNRAYDSNDDRLSRERFPSQRGKQFQDISIELPQAIAKLDSVFLRLTFEGMLDTNSFSMLFLNENEFLLPHNAQYSWLPILSTRSNVSIEQSSRIDVEISLSPEFIVVRNADVDTTIADEKKVWKFSYPPHTNFSTAFSICGSKNFIQKKTYNTDSSFAAAFYFSPQRVNTLFIDSLQTMLQTARAFFSNITKQKKNILRFAFIGSNYSPDELLRAEQLIIFGNSPAFSVYDTLAFQQSTRNEWLNELARIFCPQVVDSTAWFEEGFAGYLASRFILEKFSREPERRRHERFDVMSRALDFFPSAPIALGSRGKEHEKNILSYKGRYIFLMLEYLLGKENFDAALQAMFRYAETKIITIGAFKEMCEVQYGSSLDWFFNQWLYSSAIPEFALETEIQKTNRGLFSVKAIITQRGDLFAMPLNIVFSFNGRKQLKRIFVDKQQQEFLFSYSTAPNSVELDPEYLVLRWLVELRIYAHAQTSMMFRVYNRDLENSVKEAELTLQLDPNNNTGTNSLAYFSLGKAAIIRNEIEKGQEYFLKAMEQNAVEEILLYPLMSLIRYANTLEMQNNRNEALNLYKRALNEAYKNPLLYAPVISEAEKYLRENFIYTNEFWYGKY